VEALADPSPSTGHCTNNYGHSQQYYLHQKNYVAFLQVLLSDTKRFPGFPKDSDGTVIVGTHPDYAPPRTDEVIGDMRNCNKLPECSQFSIVTHTHTHTNTTMNFTTASIPTYIITGFSKFEYDVNIVQLLLLLPLSHQNKVFQFRIYQ